MKRIHFFCLLALWFANVACAEVAAPARRIVSLAPHLTELLFAAGAGGHVVGTVEYSDYPVEAQKIPRVGGYATVDVERIAALRPDLVVGWQSGNPAVVFEKLRALRIPLYLSEPGRLPDIAADIERLGQLAGTQTEAARAAAQYRARLAQLTRRYARAAAQPRLRVFYEVWPQPLMTVNRSQIISDVIRLCGGENVFDGLPGIAPTVSVEAVLKADPEVIIASGMDAARPEWLDDWRRWPTLAATARGNLFFVPPDLIQRHTPRVLDGAEQICRALDMARSRKPVGQ